MTTIICRLFESPQKVRDASAALRADGYARADILTLRPALQEEVFDGVGAVRAITATGISEKVAGIYARHVESGAGLIVVRAPFGTALNAREILGSFEPSAANVGRLELYESDEAGADAEPAPFSRLFGFKVLINDPAPLSRLLGLPVLKRDQSSRTVLAPSAPTFRVRLINSPAPFSRLLGLPVLFNCPAPLSSLLGLPTLIRER